MISLARSHVLKHMHVCMCAVPGDVAGCLVKETLKAGSSLRGDGYILLRTKKPAPQQNSTPIISSTLRGETEASSHLPLTQHRHGNVVLQREQGEDGGRGGM